KQDLKRLPKGLVVEGVLRLNDCTSLVTLPDDLEVKEDAHFSGCTSLVGLPRNFKLSRALTAVSCTSLRSLPQGMEFNSNVSLSKCTALKYLPEGFIVERGTPGFEQTFQKQKGSMRAGDVGELGFHDCAIPEENLLPGSAGLKSPLSCLNQARYGISWGALGAAMDCYETALNYAGRREQFGVPIASFQLVQEKLVTMLIEITKGQLLSYRLGRLMDEGKARPAQVSMAKKNNVAVARMCARTARELLGANGISLAYSPIRHMANIESVYTYEGTDDVHTLIVGADITGISALSK
ncbi:MAG: acyl-CoA dehydrogenase family protein, partial [Chloroflexi bacterium]|nr:acyl-CoA dehydrogenase family protein [Chloroflexota bacterium]